MLKRVDPRQLTLSFEWKAEEPLEERVASEIGLKTPRRYQSELIAKALDMNIIVSLPTGTGKTLVGFYFMEKAREGKKALMLCPTVALVEQQAGRFPSEDKAVITGRKGRKVEDYGATFIFGTPQTILNDLRKGVIRKEDFGAIVFDECHRAVGDHSYVRIAKGFKGRVLGLTASLGSNMDKMREICHNLSIRRVEHKDGEEVLAFVGRRRVVLWRVGFPLEYAHIIEAVSEMEIRLKKELERQLYAFGIELPKGKGDLMKVRKELEKGGWELKEARNAYWRYFYVSTFQDYLERYSLSEAIEYFEELERKEGENAKRVVKMLKEVVEEVRALREKGVEHPKAFALATRLIEEPSKTIVFTTYRKNAEVLRKEFEEVGLDAEVLLGKGDGVSGRKQVETIERFRRGEFNILISTSVGEEGLDLPSVERVVFYDEVPRAVRSIQRKGRTARINDGEVLQIVAIGTKDELYYHISRAKDRSMAKKIRELNNELAFSGGA